MSNDKTALRAEYDALRSEMAALAASFPNAREFNGMDAFRAGRAEHVAKMEACAMRTNDVLAKVKAL